MKEDSRWLLQLLWVMEEKQGWGKDSSYPKKQSPAAGTCTAKPKPLSKEQQCWLQEDFKGARRKAWLILETTGRDDEETPHQAAAAEPWLPDCSPPRQLYSLRGEKYWCGFVYQKTIHQLRIFYAIFKTKRKKASKSSMGIMVISVPTACMEVCVGPECIYIQLHLANTFLWAKISNCITNTWFIAV